jgi:comEA protein
MQEAANMKQTKPASRKLLTAEVFFLLATVAFAMFLIGYYVGNTRLPVETATITMEAAEVAEPTEELPEPTDSTETTELSSDKININTATALELTTLPGIGDVLAARIVAYREENGAFQSIDEIDNVEGIGDARFEQIKDYITVEDGT